jgi:hypothetical protein
VAYRELQGCEAYCVTGSWNVCNKLTNSTAAFDCELCPDPCQTAVWNRNQLKCHIGQCSYTNLQSVAQVSKVSKRSHSSIRDRSDIQCVTCARDGGSVTVNGTAVSFDTFMNGMLTLYFVST